MCSEEDANRNCGDRDVLDEMTPQQERMPNREGSCRAGLDAGGAAVPGTRGTLTVNAKVKIE